MRRENFYCGDDAPAALPYHYKECGLDNVYLMNGYNIEEVDGEEYVSIDSVDELWKAISLNLVTNKKLLCAQEVRFLRGQMDKTQAEVASVMRVDDQTVARWEKGKVTLSGTADVAFRVLLLSSPVVQPEGKEILASWIDTIKRLVEKDAPVDDDVVFEQSNHSWQRTKVYA